MHTTPNSTSLTKQWQLRTELAVVSAMSVVFSVAYFFTQSTWSDRAVRWDGAAYVSMAQQIAAGKAPIADAPFVYRIGFSAIAALFSPHDPVNAMRVISIICGTASVLLMWLWLSKFNIMSSVRVALVAAFALQYHGPLRFGIFFSTLTYSPFWVVLLLGLIILRWALAHESITPPLLAAVFGICVVGTLVRETMIIAPMAMLFFRPTNKKTSLTYHIIVILVAFGACVVGMLITHSLTTATGAYSFSTTAVGYFYQKSILEVLAAVFLTFGPMLAVLAVFPRKTFDLFDEHRELIVLLCVSTGLAIIGGSNTEVFLYWSAPAILAVVGIILSERKSTLLKPLLFLPLLAAQLIAQRAFWNMPLNSSSLHSPVLITLDCGHTLHLEQFFKTLCSQTAHSSGRTSYLFTSPKRDSQQSDWRPRQRSQIYKRPSARNFHTEGLFNFSDI
jgi:hypothetical protein